MSEEIFNYYVGGLALISAIISTALYARTYLPAAQILILDGLLHETRQIYGKSRTDGLLSDNFQRKFEDDLTRLEDVREELREQAYRAVTIFDQWAALLHGLSQRIMRISDSVKRMRSHLVTTSEQTRQARRIRDANAQSSTLHVSDTSVATQTATNQEEFAIGGETNRMLTPLPRVYLGETNENPTFHSQQQETTQPEGDCESVTSTLINQGGFFHRLFSQHQRDPPHVGIVPSARKVTSLPV